LVVLGDEWAAVCCAPSRDAGVQNITTKACIVVLPRLEEALAMKDDETGSPVDDHDEGYMLKREQVEMRIAHLGVDGIPIEFFDARRDSPEQLREFLVGRIQHLRSLYRTQIQDLIRTILGLLANHTKAQYQEVLRSAAQRLKIWAADSSDLGQLVDQAHDSLLSALHGAHAATIRATIRREGLWPNLDYYHHLGFGARRIAASCIGKNVEALKIVADNLLHDSELVEAHDFIRQVVHLVDTSVDAMLQKIQVAGRSAFADDLKVATDLWSDCESEWGLGSGYRDRVSVHNKDWFSDTARTPRHDFVKHMIVAGWSEVLAAVNAMLEAGLAVT
jgi:hypothetical protein